MNVKMRHNVAPLLALPAQPAATVWPTKDWQSEDLPPGADLARIENYCAELFSDQPTEKYGETRALLVVHKGKLVLEKYAAGYDADRTLKSWSMAKSMLHCLIGMAVKDGLLNIHDKPAIPEWQDPDDPRSAITLDHMLRMSSGLKWLEAYTPGETSDVIEMLFGEGKADMGAFAAAMPLAVPIDTLWTYSSGTSNIISRLLKDTLGVDRDGMEAFMRSRLLDPLGMASAAPRFDESGTFIGSSYCFCTPRDFARFGLFCLRGGVWEGQKMVPDGWIDYARTPTAIPDLPENKDWDYGAHFYVRQDGRGSFNMAGHEGQYIVMVPSQDLVIVRLGQSRSPDQTRSARFSLWEIVESFDSA